MLDTSVPFGPIVSNYVHYSIRVGRCDNGCVLHTFFQRMGTGRKTETKNVATPKQDQSNTRRYGDQSFPARNLGEDELGGVIFGCTHQTINECLSKQLFG
jgi:hypothetical protein